MHAISRAQHAAGAALESGEADLALGHFPDLEKPGCFRQKLVEVPFVCLVRREHPTIRSVMTHRQYMAASHAVVRPDGRS